MNLWLRLIFVVVRAIFRSKANLFDTTVLRLRVLPNDLDFNGHVNNGRYLALADLGRLDYVIRTGSAAIAIKLKALPIVGDAMGKFRKDLRPFEGYELHTRLLGWNDKWTFMEHRFVRSGRVCAVVVMRGLFLSRSGRIAPTDFLRALNLSLSAPALAPSVQEWSDCCDHMAEALRAEEDALVNKTPNR
jgi:acyl-CoA thioesterase FadM